MSVVYPDKALAEPGSLTYIVALSQMDVFLIKEGGKMEKLISPSVWNYCDFIYLFSEKKVDGCQWGEKKTQSKSETVNLHVQLLYFQKFLFYYFFF